MREVEGKILEIDREVVIKKLEALGAKKIFEGELRAFYYDFPDGSIRKRHHHARLRKENDKVFLVYKVKDQTSEAKVYHEHEVEVQNFDVTHQILMHLGLEPYCELVKNRLSYKLGGVRFEIDNYTSGLDLPEYLEIEAPTEEEMYAMAEKLGYVKDDVKPWNAREAAEHYKS